MASIVALKVDNTTSSRHYDPADDENYFWTEGAFHYRHFRMVAGGGSIPRIDTQIQYPEGLDIRRHVTPVMENIYGRAYRWFFRGAPPHHFLVYAGAIVSTLSVAACFFAARALNGGNWPALLTAALYGLVLGSMYRSTAAFIREDFALPFVFGSVACYFSCLRDDRPAVALTGALLLVVALAAWHVTQFFFLVFVGGIVLTVLLHGPSALPQRCFTAYAAAVIAAAFALPVLRAKFYFVSPPVMLACGLLLILYMRPDKREWSRRKSFAVTLASLLIPAAAAMAAQRATGSQSHVFAVLLAKLRHLAVLPADPGALSFEAKVMWTSSFVNLTWLEIKILFASTLLWGGLGLISIARDFFTGRGRPAATLLFYMTAATFPLAVIFCRLTVIAIFFTALPAACIRPRRHWLRYAFGALFACCLFFEVAKFKGIGIVPRLYSAPLRPPPALLSELTRYLKTHTPPDSPIVAKFERGPSIAAFADRPVLIHPKFESRGLRDKIREIYCALYEPESFFYRVCRKYKARYFVFEPDMAIVAGPQSLPYIAGHRGLPSDSTAFACQFAPENLKHLQLVWQTPNFRLFEITDEPFGEFAPQPYMVIYDRRAFFGKDPQKLISEEELTAGRQRIAALGRLVGKGRTLWERGRYEEARTAYSEALRMHSLYPPALLGMADVCLRTSRYEEAAENLAKVLRVDPRLVPRPPAGQPPEVTFTLAMAHLRAGRPETAEELMRQTVARQPGVWQAQMYLGLLLAAGGRFAEAENGLREALKLNPKAVQVHNALAQCYLQLKDRTRARQAYEESLRLQPEQQEIRNALRALDPPGARPDS